MSQVGSSWSRAASLCSLFQRAAGSLVLSSPVSTCLSMWQQSLCTLPEQQGIPATLFYCCPVPSVLVSVHQRFSINDVDHRGSSMATFPTTFRPNVVLLTRISQDSQTKQSRRKNKRSLTENQKPVWRRTCLPVEAGCSGFLVWSLSRNSCLLHIGGVRRRRTIHKPASRWLWFKRGNSWGQWL